MCSDLLCVLNYDLFWRKFHELLKRICIAWCLIEILCRFLLCPFGLNCGLVLKFLCWYFAQTTYLLVTVGYSGFPLSLCCDLSVIFMSISGLLIYLHAPMFDAYTLRIDISSWLIVLLINMKLPSLSLLSDIHLVHFIRSKYSYSCLIMESICLE
jgi:hypothetical protein